jgi:hypothetical protein
MSRKPGYSYAPLEGSDSIRLLMVENVGSTSKGRGPIRCWIRHFHLSNAPPYRALSYAWGSTDTKKIFLNDRVVEVRKNLWEALAHMQFACFDFKTAGKDQIFAEENSNLVWIDALCIDQNNIAEKNHQVGVMGKIYSGAVEVLVWLGCEFDFRNGPGISVAMEAMARMEDYKGDQNPSQIFDQNHEGLLALFQLPYWQRLWIIQEIRLATKITLLFDKISTSWDNLHKLRKLLSSTYFPNKSGLLSDSAFTMTHKAELLRCQAFRLDRHRTESHRDVLGYLIESFQDCLCADPRDKVYGLIGLAEDCQNGRIEVNYFKSLFEVYSDVIGFYSKSRRSQGPSQHTPRFSQILQQAFRGISTDSGLTTSAKEYSLASPTSVLRPSLHIFGIRCGVITTFGDAIDLAELSRFTPVAPDLTKHVKFTISNAVRDLRKLVPLQTRRSFALQGPHTIISRFLRPNTDSRQPRTQPRN